MSISPNKDTEGLLEYLTNFSTEERQETLKNVLEQRTNRIVVVLEDLHKAHNANAVLRSCDGFGIQDVYIIENKNEFDTASSVSLGAHKWLTLHRFNTPGEDNVKACFDALHAKGYKILATSPHENDTDIHQVAVNEKVALVFGTELDGISDNVKALADGFVKIPMFGFSESFNISVSAAICIYELTTRLRDADIDWRLEKGYKQELLCDWTKKSIKAGDRLEEKYYKEIKKPE